MTLDQIQVGESATVSALWHSGSMRRRLQDIGLIQNTTVECVGRSPAGDPSAYLIRGAVIAIRASDASKICVEPLTKEEVAR
jgi:ferrous iron transport protein A